jgi:hypothetical protein
MRCRPAVTHCIEQKWLYLPHWRDWYVFPQLSHTSVISGIDILLSPDSDLDLYLLTLRDDRREGLEEFHRIELIAHAASLSI